MSALTTWPVRCERCSAVAVCHVLPTAALVCAACVGTHAAPGDVVDAVAYLREAGEDVRPCATAHLADGWRWYWRDAQQLLRDDDVVAAARNLRELADVRGQRCRVDWLVTGYPATDRSDYGTVVGVDGIGTATIRRDDGAMILAGAGAWVILR